MRSPSLRRRLTPSKPGSDFDAETSSVLLNGVFRILREARVEILLIQNIKDAGRSTRTSLARYLRVLTFNGCFQCRAASALLAIAMAQRCYVSNRKTVDVLSDNSLRRTCEYDRQMLADCAGLGAFDMQRMYQYETDSHPGVQERFDRCRWTDCTGISDFAGEVPFSLRSPMFVLLIRSYFTTKTNWGVRAV